MRNIKNKGKINWTLFKMDFRPILSRTMYLKFVLFCVLLKLSLQLSILFIYIVIIICFILKDFVFFFITNSVRKNMNIVRKYMGYCPQFDALDGLLTGKELLVFYAQIRGMNLKDGIKVSNIFMSSRFKRTLEFFKRHLFHGVFKNWIYFFEKFKRFFCTVDSP